MVDMQTQVSRMLRAASDPIRLRILGVLHTGELCVGDLVTVLRLPQPTVSRHLAYLRRSGLVKARKDGPWAHYRLTEANTNFHQGLLGCLETCLRDVPELKADVERASELRVDAEGDDKLCPA